MKQVGAERHRQLRRRGPSPDACAPIARQILELDAPRLQVEEGHAPRRGIPGRRRREIEHQKGAAIDDSQAGLVALEDLVGFRQYRQRHATGVILGRRPGAQRRQGLANVAERARRLEQQIEPELHAPYRAALRG